MVTLEQQLHMNMARSLDEMRDIALHLKALVKESDDLLNNLTLVMAQDRIDPKRTGQ